MGAMQLLVLTMGYFACSGLAVPLKIQPGASKFKLSVMVNADLLARSPDSLSRIQNWMETNFHDTVQLQLHHWETEAPRSSLQRRLQSHGGTRLVMTYSVSCQTSACESIRESMNALTDGGEASLAHAQRIIDGMNEVGQQLGFGSVVLSSAGDVAATMSEPELVTINIPIPQPPPPPPPDPCAETLAVGDGGHLDFDASYGNGEDCRWLVSCDSGVPTVSFNSFQTEANYDYVNIYEGNSTDAERIARLHGGVSPPDVTTEGSLLLVQFTS
eukprot:SAG31_NODE_4861_length_2901_cov_18.987509_1_plen_271_part_01